MAGTLYVPPDTDYSFGPSLRQKVVPPTERGGGGGGGGADDPSAPLAPEGLSKYINKYVYIFHIYY